MSAMSATPAPPSWHAIAFNNSTQREINSRAATAWRKTRSTHIDMLVGNYLSNYFQDLGEAIRTGASWFKRPRRTDGMRFYERCLPPKLPLRPWPPFLPRVKPAGHWDWFVFDNQTDAFWSSMRPLVRHVLDQTLDRCGLRATLSAPVLHFRCASAPLNRHSQYHFQRYSFFRAAARRYKRRFKGAQLKQLHLLTCVADDVQKSTQAATCTAYLDDLVSFLTKEMQIDVRVHNCAHSQFEDFAIMYGAPFLISTGSTMSLLPGLANHGGRRNTFVSPRLYDEESLAHNSRAPSRRVGCASCDWMLQRDHSVCHCEVADYSNVPKVLTALRQSAPPLAADKPPADQLCPACKGIHCDKFRPIACEVGSPSSSSANAAADLRSHAVHAAGCDAAGARLMSQDECKAAAGRQGRKWLGASRNDEEAPGCVMWEEGNVEYNSAKPKAGAAKCNVRGTCLCAPKAGGELQVVGVA